MPRLIDILYSMAALGLALWGMTITTLAFGADDPLAWVPPGQRINIKLEVSAE